MAYGRPKGAFPWRPLVRDANPDGADGGHTAMPSRRVLKTKRLFEGRRALGVVVGACGVAFGLGVLIRYTAFQAFDLAVTKTLQETSSPALDTAMVAFTTVAEPVVVPALGFVVAGGLWWLGLHRAAKLVLGSTLSVPANIALKTFWDRERPDKEIVNVAVETAGTSFPSGHTMGGTALYGALAALAWIHLDPRKTRWPIVLFLMVLPVGTGVSRVYLGAHWLSDVVAGAALGLLVLVPLVGRYLRAIPAEVEEQAAIQSRALPRPNPALAA